MVASATLRCARRSWFLAAALFCLPPGPAAAQAEQPSQGTQTASANSPRATASESAREAFGRGLRLARAGDYRGSIPAFERAYALEPHYAVLYNIGLSYAKLGDVAQAVAHLQRYLAEAGDRASTAERLRVLKQVNSLLEEALSERRASKTAGEAPELARLRATCDVPGVLLSLDQTKIALSPYPPELFVPAGSHALTFSRAGYRQRSVRLDTAPGKDAHIDCGIRVQQPLSGATAGRLALSGLAADAEVLVDGRQWDGRTALPVGPHRLQVKQAGRQYYEASISVPPGETVEHQVPAPPWDTQGSALRDNAPNAPAPATSRRNLAYVLGGLGLAAGGTAVGLAIWNHDRAKEWRDEDAALRKEGGALNNFDPPQAPSADTLVDLESRRVANNALGASVRRFHWVSGVSGVLGVSLLGAGAYLFFSADETAEYGVGYTGRELLLTGRW